MSGRKKPRRKGHRGGFDGLRSGAGEVGFASSNGGRGVYNRSSRGGFEGFSRGGFDGFSSAIGGGGGFDSTNQGGGGFGSCIHSGRGFKGSIRDGEVASSGRVGGGFDSLSQDGGGPSSSSRGGGRFDSYIQDGGGYIQDGGCFSRGGGGFNSSSQGGGGFDISHQGGGGYDSSTQGGGVGEYDAELKMAGQLNIFQEKSIICQPKPCTDESNVLPMLARQKQNLPMEETHYQQLKVENLQLKNFNFQLMEQKSQLNAQVMELQGYINQVEGEKQMKLQLEEDNNRLKTTVKNLQAYKNKTDDVLKFTKQLKNQTFQLKEQNVLLKNRLKELQTYVKHVEEGREEPEVIRRLKVDNHKLQQLLQEEMGFRMVDKIKIEKMAEQAKFLENNVKLVEQELQHMKNLSLPITKESKKVKVNRSFLEKLVSSKVQKATNRIQQEICDLSAENHRLVEANKVLEGRLLATAKIRNKPGLVKRKIISSDSEDSKPEVSARYKIPRFRHKGDNETDKHQEKKLREKEAFFPIAPKRKPGSPIYPGRSSSGSSSLLLLSCVSREKDSLVLRWEAASDTLRSRIFPYTLEIRQPGGSWRSLEEVAAAKLPLEATVESALKGQARVGFNKAGKRFYSNVIDI